ncbi:hypothetical protein C9374_004363 [Naegleria lovaniensis]|uniref:Uncharacterized protein n=1 Tax=Naegleria lovaniensis TaxID=51637 RepID=A0AA88GSS4_NAELO|nr:uncharacterized protein C9374_004363 [Naegleria lovaniensis]KAG2383692.1 hypothetical protein C9374_004363 [Naegleria lovaniensis]
MSQNRTSLYYQKAKDILQFDLRGCLENCTKQRWSEYQQELFGSDLANDDDEKRIEKYVEDQYSNDCGLAKQWIKNDLKQKRKKLRDSTCRNDQNELDLSWLSKLDENVKFDILEFIPTYSKWNVFKEDHVYQIYLRNIKFPKRERPENNPHEYFMDIPFITFHKMRLICKRFNTRMMRRILQTTELTLFELSNTTLPYFATFLRMQRLFKENNDKLPTDSIYLYQDVNMLSCYNHNRNLKKDLVLELKHESEQEKTQSLSNNSQQQWSLQMIPPTTSKTQSTGFVFPSTPFSFQISKSESNNYLTNVVKDLTSPQNGLFTPLQADNVPKQSFWSNFRNPAEIKAPKKPSPQVDGFEHQTHTPIKEQDLMEPAYEIKPHKDLSYLVECSSNSSFDFDPFSDSRKQSLTKPSTNDSSTDSVSISDFVCTSFIGNNTTVTSILLYATVAEVPPTLFTCLKSLQKAVIWTCKGRVLLSSPSVKEVVMINSMSNIDDLQEDFPNVTTFTCYNFKPVDTTSSRLQRFANIISSKRISQLFDFFQTLDSRISMKLMNIIGTTVADAIVISEKPQGRLSLYVFIEHLVKERGAECAMEFMTFLLKDLHFPSELLGMFFLSALQVVNSRELQCVTQFTVYLCNEYRDGILLQLPIERQTFGREVEPAFLLLISYGWNWWAQNECIYLCISFFKDKRQERCVEYLLEHDYLRCWDIDHFYSLMLHCIAVQQPLITVPILSYLLMHREELLMNLLCMRVKCERRQESFVNSQKTTTLHVPMLGLLFRIRVYGGLVLQRAVERMPPEQFEQLGVTERGDTILHILLHSMRESQVIVVDSKKPQMVAC